MTGQPIESFLPALAAGDADRFAELFADRPVIDDPRHGRIEGRPATREYVAGQRAWMAELAMELAPIRTTVGGGRSLVEYVVRLTVDGQRTELPIAVVGDHDGDRLSFVRVYHSNWPLEGRHRIRPPILPDDPGLVLPDVIGEYMAALGSADLAASAAVFEDDGYFREPSGGPHVYRGSDGIRSAYGAFYAVGPIHLLHCTTIDDGIVCGVEFIAIGWGPRRFPPQAGIGVYERGATGRLHAARIYDDVDVDLGLQPAS
jgi:ketosteroid isomerase-like protein